ncbi:hypothetical protein NKG94_31005 [Micromonospora sp. M12]
MNVVPRADSTGHPPTEHIGMHRAKLRAPGAGGDTANGGLNTGTCTTDAGHTTTSC